MTSVRKSNGKKGEMMVVSILSLRETRSGLILGLKREEMEEGVPDLYAY
jgi:hypothetical protein